MCIEAAGSRKGHLQLITLISSQEKAKPNPRYSGSAILYSFPSTVTLSSPEGTLSDKETLSF